MARLKVIHFVLGLSIFLGNFSFAQENYPLIGSFRNTHYYSVLEDDFAQFTKQTNVYNMQDEVLAVVSVEFKKAMDIEGTGKVKDGRVLNYAGRKAGGIRYMVSEFPFGNGIGKCALVPFRTVAVDSKKIMLGSTVYISETDGMKLPDGSIHDGLWKAEDVGGAIKGDRIDLYVGEGKKSGEVLTQGGIGHLQPLTVKLVSLPGDDSCAK